MSLIKRIRHKGRLYLSAAIHFFLIQSYISKVRKGEPNVRFIAVAMIEHLGDIVACEPIARYLKEKDPSAKIIWLVRHAYRELVSSNPLVDLAITVHCLSEKDYLAEWCFFDRVVDLHFLERYCALCGGSASAGKTERKNESGITLSNFYKHGGILQSVSLFAGLPPLNDTPRLHISDTVKLTVDALRLPGQFVVVHCTSNTPEKDLPREKWIQLTTHITTTYGLDVMEVGLQSVLAEPGVASYRNLTGRLTILQTAEVIRRAKLFIGIDSGPAHLANAVGTHGIVLLGSYLGFRRYNPFSGAYGSGANASLVHIDGPVAGLSIDSVQQKVDEALKQSMPKA